MTYGPPIPPLPQDSQDLVSYNVYVAAREKLLKEVGYVKGFILLFLAVSSIVLGFSVVNIFSSAKKFDEAIEKRKAVIEAETTKIKSKIEKLDELLVKFEPDIEDRLSTLDTTIETSDRKKSLLEDAIEDARKEKDKFTSSYYKSIAQFETSSQQLKKIRLEQDVNNDNIAKQVNKLKKLEFEVGQSLKNLESKIDQSLNKIQACHLFTVTEQETNQNKDKPIEFFNNLEVNVDNPQGGGFISRLTVFDTNDQKIILDKTDVRVGKKFNLPEYSSIPKYRLRTLAITDQGNDKEDAALFEICGNLANLNEF